VTEDTKRRVVDAMGAVHLDEGRMKELLGLVTLPACRGILEHMGTHSTEWTKFFSAEDVSVCY
jgi:hypothetical protein